MKISRQIAFVYHFENQNNSRQQFFQNPQKET